MFAALVTLILFLNGALAPDATRDAAAVVRALEARYHRASTLKATFFEQYSDGKGGGSAESGIVYFSKPGRMRWEYQSPEEKLFIVDGTNVWFYVPADHTASRAKIGKSTDWRTPLAFLTGKSDLTHLCKSLEILQTKPGADSFEAPTAPDDSVLRCVPRSESSETGDEIRDVLLEADPAAHLVRVSIRQPGNLTTEFRFKDWEEGLPIAETKFHFAPPAGVSIVDEADLAGSIR
ncbi:MAG TPA: outer membrane lipoprotein carrier protein LolA [Candidatus Acidoferrales bacterium]